MSIMRYESGKIDWCEPNYVYSNYIVEFWNTLSNIMFLIFGYYGIKYCRNNRLDISFYKLFVTYIFIGISSAYFHGTLSLLGQILDEICIYVLLVLSLKNFVEIKNVYLVLSVFVMFIYPKYNPFILFVIGFFIMIKVFGIYNRINKIQKTLGILTTIMFFVSIGFWVFDKICMYENVVHTHFIFHISVSIMGFVGILFLDFITNNRINFETFDSII